uniref:Uncharacterized protein n=1 Tax=Setaria italica TaxID=4555 RepID=K3YWR2_SETIT
MDWEIDDHVCDLRMTAAWWRSPRSYMACSGLRWSVLRGNGWFGVGYCRDDGAGDKGYLSAFSAGWWWCGVVVVAQALALRVLRRWLNPTDHRVLLCFCFELSRLLGAILVALLLYPVWDISSF